MLTAKETRDSFKNFFESKGHQIVPSAPMVIKDDPTLMFTNAGMNQFKDIILGNHPAKYHRVADSQKCLRVSGKHNDLEEVGHDTYHHTMFEMLGNWSFGDYFKKEAISWAWEYLVDVLKLNPEHLYATVFEGSPEEGLERDNEAASYWEQYLPKDHIINGNKHDNFWEMGDTGPCGPCSEIHIDLRPAEERAKISGRDLVNHDHPQVIEIWNLVFMQYNRKADSTLEPLPAKVIDTGMGFERLCMALQGKTSNYDTDVFQPLIKAIAQMAGTEYGKNEQNDIAMRVIADHIRTIAFSITDGQLPSNAKAGYVIRRILRRAVRYGYTFLGQKQAFMYKLLPVLIDSMGDAYPELIAQKELIEKVIKEEEESFLRTLETGIRLLDKTMADTKANGKTEISGKDAFTLYDTFGFPLDLTELILRENGMTVNVEEFDAEMQQQKQRARNAAAIETGDWIILKEGTTEFVGYDYTEYETSILRYRQVKQKNQTLYQIVLDYTPFYAESGGQMGDKGTFKNKTTILKVDDTFKIKADVFGHMCYVAEGEVKVGDLFSAQVDEENREATARNHSVTHLMHKALREVLGAHVQQRGSMVNGDRTRFDFVHTSPMTREQINEVEDIVNKEILRNAPTQTRVMPIDEAKKTNAVMLFGEKYGEKVRVLNIGSSCELCGGTHVQRTGDIGMFKIISESGISAGVRRVEAVTGMAALHYAQNQEEIIREVAEELKAPALEVVSKVVDTVEHLKRTEKDLNALKVKFAQAGAAHVASQAQDVNGVKVLVTEMKGIETKELRNSVDGLKDQLKSGVIVLIKSEDGKASAAVGVTKDLVGKIKAGDVMKFVAEQLGGKGGGRPDFAQGGGAAPADLNALLGKIRTFITEKLA